MPQKKVLIGLMLGCFFLVGTGSAIAALWDQSCRVAINNLQRLQEKVALKKQEIDVARIVEAIPANFVSGNSPRIFMRKALWPRRLKVS